jgi:hypothetical protein
MKDHNMIKHDANNKYYTYHGPWNLSQITSVFVSKMLASATKNLNGNCKSCFVFWVDFRKSGLIVMSTEPRHRKTENLGTLSSNTAGQLNILGHDCHTLRVDSAQVGVLKQTNKVSFRRFL